MTARPKRWSVPQILFVITVAALIAALVGQLVRFPQPLDVLAFVLTACYLGWVVVEARITFSSAEAPARPDRTLLPYALVRFGTALTAVLIPLPWQGFSWWMLVPAIVFLGGVALRQWAIVVLGRFYSHKLVRQRDHAVVTSGPYSVVRHPAYTGMLTAHLGFVALFCNVFSVTGFVLLVAVLTWRIGREERMLSVVPSYAAYSMGTRRLVPGLW